MNDLTLFFLPQWSPFQPPLSLPSLAAWLRRAGYHLVCIDANILFYRWLLSDDCAACALDLIELCDRTTAEKEAFRSILSSRRDFQRDLSVLKNNVYLGPDTKAHLISRHFIAIKSLETYLFALSSISGDFVVTPYRFNLTSGSDSASLESFAANPPQLIQAFLQRVIAPVFSQSPSRIVGLSCIGEEQLPFALLFGKAIKQITTSSVVVGGTILPRIFERGILKSGWLRDYFDVIVRNEGEKPCEKMMRNLASGIPLTQNVSGLVFLSSDNLVCSTAPSPALKPEEVPPPDFDDLCLDSYISSETTLPLLASRGCYWGKCEFCHHYMVYGNGYTTYKADDIVATVQHLSAKYGVKRFAFNDEAVPPKILSALGHQLPNHNESGFTFTALIKFEKYLNADHFKNLARVGFRSLYIGLESASERVLTLMKKPNRMSTILRNLQDATEAGIWTHCFLFFGFPGESEEDAGMTFDFVVNHSEIISSFGCGTFVLEHNAPIQKHLDDFGVKESLRNSDVSVYYAYAVESGISQRRAHEWVKALDLKTRLIDKYRATRWIPREFLLCLISYVTREDIVKVCTGFEQMGGIPGVHMGGIVSMTPALDEESGILVNRMDGKVARVRNKLFRGISVCLKNRVTSWDVFSLNPQVDEFLTLGGGV